MVQSYFGHASLKMTMDLYTHVTDKESMIDIEKIVPEKTLIIFDEVQDCPKVINSMKYFCETAPPPGSAGSYDLRRRQSFVHRVQRRTD